MWKGVYEDQKSAAVDVERHFAFAYLGGWRIGGTMEYDDL